MQNFSLAASLLLGTISVVLGQIISAGACGPTSVANVPGCWGQPGCAYIIASDLGAGAACSYDYCNCGGIAVPLLPETVSGTTTIGCDAYTTQPSGSNCPTAAPVVPPPSSLGSSPASNPVAPVTTTPDAAGSSPASNPVAPASTTPDALSSSPASNPVAPVSTASGSSNTNSPPANPPTGAIVVTGTISGQTITETYVPTTYTQFATVTAIVTTTIFDAKSSPATIVIGPSGVAWTPYNPVSGVPNVQPPSVLPGTPGGTLTAVISSVNPSIPLTSGGTVLIGTLGSSILTETFIPATLSGYASLASTITTTTLDAQSSPVTILIGPGGVFWTPLNLPSGVPELPPPSVFPANPNAPSITPSSPIAASDTPGTPPITTSQTPTSVGASPSGTLAESYASITGAFDNTAQSETTIIVGGVTEHWSKATFADLSTITAPTTVTTPIVQTNNDGSQFTVSAAIVIVGPGGVWWNGGTGGLGLHGPSCIWPFCPPGGGGDIGGAGSGGSPNDPNSPGSPEEPTDPDEDNNQSSKPSTSTPTSSGGSSSSSSSCSASAIASDCSVLCSVPTGVTTQSCSTSCYSTVTECSATGTTITSTASGAACARPTGWSNVVDGDDAGIYQPLGTANPGSASGSSSPVSITGSVTDGVTATAATLTTPISSNVPDSSSPSTPTPASSNIPNSSSPSPATITAPTPTCLADGAPWYSPTSWCDCGPSSTYETLSPTSGATSANCAYVTLPASTIQPISTSAAPTNIPGIGGVPGCAAVVSAPGTSAYCNCGGTPAPLLSPTSTGFLNCGYTIQPTSSYDPAVPPPTSAASPPTSAAPPPPPYATGKCNIHVWQGLGQELTDPEVVIDVNITDANGAVIGYGSSKLNWAETFSVDSKLEYVMEITPKTGLKKRRSARTYLGKRLGGPVPTRPLFEKGPVDFAFGAQSWDTTSSQCSVGGWDNGNANDFFGALIFGDDKLPNRQMDCKFDCPGSSKKRAVAKRYGYLLENDQGSRRDILTRDPSPTVEEVPSVVDDHLFDVRALTDRGAAWQKYAPSGARYYAAWQAKTGADAVYQCNFEEDFNINPITNCKPARPVQPLLSANGYSVEKEYYAITATGPKDGEIADFTNTISASQGVFLANANNRGAKPSDPTDPMFDPNFPSGRQPVPWQFSTVAWWMWTKTVLTANPAWAADPSLADYSGIRSFWRREIDNPDTKAILDEAFSGHDITATLTWTPDNPDLDQNPFWALLGSPNGNGIQYFLTDNKVALRGKGVQSISATTIAGYYSMWATFT